MKLQPWYVNNKCVLLITCSPNELQWANQAMEDLKSINLFDGCFIVDVSMNLKIGEAV